MENLKKKIRKWREIELFALLLETSFLKKNSLFKVATNANSRKRKWTRRLGTNTTCYLVVWYFRGPEAQYFFFFFKSDDMTDDQICTVSSSRGNLFWWARDGSDSASFHSLQFRSNWSNHSDDVGICRFILFLSIYNQIEMASNTQQCSPPVVLMRLLRRGTFIRPPDGQHHNAR